MARTTVRMTEETRAVLRELAQESNETMQQVLAKAVKAYRRQGILERTNAAYAALRADQRAWRDLREERAAWDATLTDGSPER